jgi:hypothetical protein
VEQVHEWQAATSFVDHQRAVLLSPQGAAPLLFQKLLATDATAYLTPGTFLPNELDEMLRNFANAPIAIAVIDPGYDYYLTYPAGGRGPSSAPADFHEPIFRGLSASTELRCE